MAKCSQIGRNKLSCSTYRLENRRIKNKRIKMGKHLKRHPKDTQSIKALGELKYE